MLIAFVIASILVGLFLVWVADGRTPFAIMVRIAGSTYVIWAVMILLQILPQLDLGAMKVI